MGVWAKRGTRSAEAKEIITSDVCKRQTSTMIMFARIRRQKISEKRAVEVLAGGDVTVARIGVC